MKIINYILITITMGIAVSCSKFLEEDPKSIISEEQFYNTPSDILNAVNASYFFYNAGGVNGSSQSAYNSLLQVGLEFSTDEQYPGPGAGNADVRSFSTLGHSSANRTFYENWQQHYEGIKRANIVLEKIEQVDFKNDTLTKKRYIGEALFNRAFIYFNLVRLFGDIPLVTKVNRGIKASDYYIAKSLSTDVYAQIEQDLNTAAIYLPNSYTGGDKGRATAGAAKALLAKVYLIEASFPLQIKAKYTLAINKAEEVLRSKDGGTGDAYGYDLRTNYADVFLPATKNNEEHIFSAQYTGNSQGQGRNDFPRTLPQFPTSFGISGSYADQVNFHTKGNDKSFSIYKLYQSKDKRKYITFRTLWVNPKTGAKYANTFFNTALPDKTLKNKAGGDSINAKGNPILLPNDTIPYFYKTFDPNAFVSITGEAATNVTLLRYAEVLLIHAEAENEVNGPTAKAYKSINRIRNRAGLPNLTAGLTQDQFRDSVYLDRELELVYEYQRWFDLVRQRDAAGNNVLVAKLIATGKVNAKEKHRLLPLPQIELDNNPLLEQSPLWK